MSSSCTLEKNFGKNPFMRKWDKNNDPVGAVNAELPDNYQIDPDTYPEHSEIVQDLEELHLLWKAGVKLTRTVIFLEDYKDLTDHIHDACPVDYVLFKTDPRYDPMAVI